MSAIERILDSAHRLTSDDSLSVGDAMEAFLADETEARAELAAMREELADWRDSAKRAAGEDCAPDEKHCTCVGVLRATIAQQQKRIEAVERLASALEAFCASDSLSNERSLDAALDAFGKSRIEEPTMERNSP